MPDGAPLPFEFVVTGRPVSHQSHNKASLAAWRRDVRAAAEAKWASLPALTIPLKVTVVFYHDGAVVRLDDDNMVKPIRDALNGLVYDDDGRITTTVVQKRPIDRPIIARRQSRVLLGAFADGVEFVHVVVDYPPDDAIPLR